MVMKNGDYDPHGGSSFVHCGECCCEFLTPTWIAVEVGRNRNAENVCDRCGVQGYSCSDCGEYCVDGSGWCDSCFRREIAYEAWMFEGLSDEG